MRNKKITQTQQKMVFASGIILLGAVILWLGLYRPTQLKVFILKAKLNNIERQLQEIQALTVDFSDKEAGIRELQKRSQKLDQQFLSNEEAGYKIISDLASKHGIEIVSFQPEAKADYLDGNGNRMVVDGKSCSKVPISLELKGNYKDLVDYIETLEHPSAFFATLESVKITKTEFRVDAILNITLYLLS